MPVRPALTISAFILISVFLGTQPSRILAQEAKLRSASLPLVFEQNEGQAPASYQFLARRSGSETFYSSQGMDVFVPISGNRAGRLRIRWMGATKQAQLIGEDQLPGYSNYLIGSDETRWLRGVPQFGRIRYVQIYPGVDLSYHGSENQLENDFIVAPGVNPSEITLQFDRPLRVTASGDLEATVDGAVVRLNRPIAYQDFGTARNEVRAKFVLAGKRRVKFQVGEYDHKHELIIDPVFGFSTYLDGSSADLITAVTADPSGNIYVTGFTGSTDFPITNANNPLCPPCSDVSQTNEAFISKLDPTGHTLLYSTFLGGSNGALGYSIGLDKTGNIYVAGVSQSGDFPHTGSVLPLTIAFLNSNYYFVASLKPDGSALNYSGLVGGEEGFYTDGQSGKMAVDQAGNAYLAGTTYDANFQLTAGTLDSTPSSYPYDTMFVLKLDPTGKLVYSTLVPGNVPRPVGTAYADNFVSEGIVVDAKGQVTVAGLGGIGLPTTPGAPLATIPKISNAIDPTAGFLLQLNATASALNFATYLPGTTGAAALAADAMGDFYIAGATNETNLPVGPNSYQKTPMTNVNSCCGGYILKIDPLGKSVLAATYLSGTGGSTFRGVALDNNSNVLVGGYALSSDFPLQNPFVSTYRTSETAAAMVLAELDKNLSSLLFGSFLSSTNSSDSYAGSSFSALTFDPMNNAVVVGTTLANHFPTTPNSFQQAPPPPNNPLVGYQHSFISKLDLGTPAPSVCFSSAFVSFPTVLVNTPETVALTVTNCGNAPLQISSVTSSLAVVTGAQSCGAIAAGNTCAVQLTFTPIDTSVSSGTITLTDNAAITQQTISFSGQGGLPQLFFPPTIQVSDLLVGTQGKFIVFFENSGDANWIVNSVTATGDFSVDTSLCPSPIEPLNPFTPGNLVCQLGITFSPTQPGQRTGTLTIADNVPGSPHVIQLIGNGLTFYSSPSIAAIEAIPTDTRNPFLLVVGNGFFPGSQINVNGSPRTLVYISGQEIAAVLTPSDLAGAAEVQVMITNPSPGGGTSNTGLGLIYQPIRNLGILHSVFEPKSGLVYASISAQSATDPGQIVVIDPAAGKITKSFSAGNGPNQLAISDDGSLLYVGLDTDKKVAQVAIPAGTVNFAVGLGNDLIFQNPMVADAIRVFPGQPHTWAVTLCGVGFGPCGQGVAVFDDAVARPTQFLQEQAEPDSLLFVGSNALTLYGTTLFQIPSTLYEFSINSGGITESQTAQNFSSTSPGGGVLDTDGKSIYVSNGQIINPSTLAITGNIGPLPYSPGIRVDLPASRVYFAGGVSGLQTQFAGLGIEAFDLSTQQQVGSVVMPESSQNIATDIFRWGSDGLAVAATNGVYLMHTSLTSGKAAPSQFYVSGLSPTSVPAGSADLPLTISGGGFASGDSLTVNGDALSVTVTSGSQLSVTIPAAILSEPGDVQIVLSDTSGDVANLELVVTPAQTQTSVGLSTNFLTFPVQLVGTSSSAQTVTISNIGTAPLQISSITASGDFLENSTCKTIAAGSSCPVTVTFKPTVAGARSGFLTINDNDASKTQSVTLSGVGGNIQIIGTGNSGTSATVSGGGTANYSLSVAAQGGLTGQATFSCTNLPQYASCNFNTPGITLTSGAQTVTVTIITQQRSQSAALKQASVPATAVLVLPFVLLSMAVFGIGSVGGRSRHRAKLLVAGLLLSSMPVIGCGGGPSGTTPPPVAFQTPAGTYTVNFVATTSQGSESIPLTLVVQ